MEYTKSFLYCPGTSDYEVNVLKGYSQIIDTIAAGEADIGIGNIMISEERLKVCRARNFREKKKN